MSNEKEIEEGETKKKEKKSAALNIRGTVMKNLSLSLLNKAGQIFLDIIF